jgi:hypothetical protein
VVAVLVEKGINREKTVAQVVQVVVVAVSQAMEHHVKVIME